MERRNCVGKESNSVLAPAYIVGKALSLYINWYYVLLENSCRVVNSYFYMTIVNNNNQDQGVTGTMEEGRHIKAER